MSLSILTLEAFVTTKNLILYTVNTLKVGKLIYPSFI